jgi:hypothetical protein
MPQECWSKHLQFAAPLRARKHKARGQNQIGSLYGCELKDLGYLQSGAFLSKVFSGSPACPSDNGQDGAEVFLPRLQNRTEATINSLMLSEAASPASGPLRARLC